MICVRFLQNDFVTDDVVDDIEDAAEEAARQAAEDAARNENCSDETFNPIDDILNNV